MTTPITLTGSLDDIVFEGRNQAYGAYQLRRSYEQNLRSALIMALSICALLLLVPLAIQYFRPDVIVPKAPPFLPPVEPQVYELPKAPTAPPAAGSRPTITITPTTPTIPHVVPNDQVIPPIKEITPTTTTVDELTGPVGIGTGEGTGTGVGTGLGTGTGTGTDTAAPAVAPAPGVVLAPDVMPEFAGGRAALQRYLQKHLRYPASALAAQASGRVYVSFVVQADGSIAEVTILKGLGYGTEEEATRVVRNMPAWIPGKQNSHSVPVRFTLPITFRFE